MQANSPNNKLRMKRAKRSHGTQWNHWRSTRTIPDAKDSVHHCNVNDLARHYSVNAIDDCHVQAHFWSNKLQMKRAKRSHGTQWNHWHTIRAFYTNHNAKVPGLERFHILQMWKVVDKSSKESPQLLKMFHDALQADRLATVSVGGFR